MVIQWRDGTVALRQSKILASSDQVLRNLRRGRTGSPSPIYWMLLLMTGAKMLVSEARRQSESKTDTTGAEGTQAATVVLDNSTLYRSSLGA